MDQSEYPALKSALDKLLLNDSSVDVNVDSRSVHPTLLSTLQQVYAIPMIFTFGLHTHAKITKQTIFIFFELVRCKKVNRLTAIHIYPVLCSLA